MLLVEFTFKNTKIKIVFDELACYCVNDVLHVLLRKDGDYLNEIKKIWRKKIEICKEMDTLLKLGNLK